MRIVRCGPLSQQQKGNEGQVYDQESENKPFHGCIVSQAVLPYHRGILLRMLAKKVREDMMAAMKARDDLRKETLRGALSSFTNELVAKGKKPTEELSDEDAVTVLKRLSKQRKDAAQQYLAGGRSDLADKELSEDKIIKEYLPQMAGREEIEKVVREKVAELGVTDKSGAGKLTGAVIKAFAGNVDGGDVKAVIESVLG